MNQSQKTVGGSRASEKRQKQRSESTKAEKRECERHLGKSPPEAAETTRGA